MGLDEVDRKWDTAGIKRDEMLQQIQKAANNNDILLWGI